MIEKEAQIESLIELNGIQGTTEIVIEIDEVTGTEIMIKEIEMIEGDVIDHQVDAIDLARPIVVTETEIVHQIGKHNILKRHFIGSFMGCLLTPVCVP